MTNTVLEKLEIRGLDEQDIPRAGDLCARTFLNARGYVGIYGGTEEWRLGELRYLFENNIRMIWNIQPDAIYGGYDCTDPSQPKLVCFFMFPRSDVPSATLWQKIAAGLLLIPFRSGWDVFSRLIASSSHYDTIFQQVMPQAHFELQRMVVDPTYQGSGLGSRCLSEALNKADKLNLPVILSTQEERNVRFYSKLGFEICRQEKFSPTGQTEDEYDDWILIRQPKPISN